MSKKRITVLLLIAAAALAAGVALVRLAPPAPAPAQGGQSAVEARLNETVSANDVSITPVEVVEDSRCPTDVTCIHAGRVRVRVTLASGLGTADQMFTIGEPITTEAEIVTLTEVRPAPVSTKTIADSDYRFAFTIDKRTSAVVGGERDVQGCLISAGYAFDSEVGACIRAFEMTEDIKQAARKAVAYAGEEYALAVVAFNSYEEPGAYDITLERGAERVKETIYIRNGKAGKAP